MEASEVWVVRYELLGGDHTSTRITRKGNPLEWCDLQEWAEAQVRANKHVLCVDEVYVPEENNVTA